MRKFRGANLIFARLDNFAGFSPFSWKWRKFRSYFGGRNSGASSKTFLVFTIFCIWSVAQADSRVTARYVLDGSLENVDAEGATASSVALNSLVPAPGSTPTNLASRFRLTSNASWIALRVENDADIGVLYANVESGVNVDGGGTQLGSRNTAVGIAGSYGNLFFGQWDTPYKESTRTQDPFYRTTIAGSQGFLGSPGFGVVGTTSSGRVGNINDASFHRRQGNSVQYWLPKMDGLRARLAYSVNEGKTATTSPDVWSGLISYDRERVYLGAAYEIHRDYFGLSAMTPSAGLANTTTNSGSKDTGLKLAVGWYLFDNHSPGRPNLNLIYEKLSYENDDSVVGNVDSYKRNLWYLSGWHQVGVHKLRAVAAVGNDGSCSLYGGGSCSTQGLGVTGWALGYAYQLAKNAELYCTYVQIDNDSAARYTMANALTGFGSGANPSGIAIGIRVTDAWALLGPIIKQGYR